MCDGFLTSLDEDLPDTTRKQLCVRSTISRHPMASKFHEQRGKKSPVHTVREIGLADSGIGGHNRGAGAVVGRCEPDLAQRGGSRIEWKEKWQMEGTRVCPEPWRTTMPGILYYELGLIYGEHLVKGRPDVPLMDAHDIIG